MKIRKGYCTHPECGYEWTIRLKSPKVPKMCPECKRRQYKGKPIVRVEEVEI